MKPIENKLQKYVDKNRVLISYQFTLKVKNKNNSLLHKLENITKQLKQPSAKAHSVAFQSFFNDML